MSVKTSSYSFTIVLNGPRISINFLSNFLSVRHRSNDDLFIWYIFWEILILSEYL